VRIVPPCSLAYCTLGDTIHWGEGKGGKKKEEGEGKGLIATSPDCPNHPSIAIAKKGGKEHPNWNPEARHFLLF